MCPETETRSAHPPPKKNNNQNIQTPNKQEGKNNNNNNNKKSATKMANRSAVGPGLRKTPAGALTDAA